MFPLTWRVTSTTARALPSSAVISHLLLYPTRKLIIRSWSPLVDIMKKHDGADYVVSYYSCKVRTFTRWSGGRVTFLTDVSFMLLVSAVLYYVHTAQHALHATRSSHEKAAWLSVRPSVCLSVKRVNCNNTEERSAKIFYIIGKVIYPSFLGRAGWWGRPFYLNFLSIWPRWSEIADFQSIFARSA